LIDCRDIRPELSNYIEHEVDSASRARIAFHLGECEECAAALDEIQRVVALLADTNDLALPAGFEDRLRKRLSAHIEPARVQTPPGLYKQAVAWFWSHATFAYERTLAERKRALFAGVHGKILEIGPGTGANLIHYRGRETDWIGIEPNPYMHAYLKKEAEKLGIAVDLRGGVGERLEIEDNSIDAVVATLVLCSVNNLADVLREILRVLKPGGQFFFMEHVAAPRGTWLRRIQQWIRPIWKPLLDGCRPDQETWIALEQAGFATVTYDRFTGPIPIASPHIIGVAVKKSCRP